MNDLVLRNLQRDQRIDARLLQRVARDALEEIFPARDREIGVHLIGRRRMAQINRQFLAHEGPTDVITFDHGGGDTVHGEIFICVAVAENQAREFQTSWQKELVRYLVHGLLHLRGYDDKTAVSRQLMKREENRIVRRLGFLHPLSELELRTKLKP